jgi:hypothetical protein
VLLVGNSLTDGNDLPLMVEALSRAGGHALTVEAVTYGGVALEDHWNLGTQNRKDVGATLLPAGDAWVAAWRQDPGLRLYGSDGFHPTVLGSYIAALVIYGGLANASPSGLPARLQLRNGRTVEVSAREATIAQAAAAEVLR